MTEPTLFEPEPGRDYTPGEVHDGSRHLTDHAHTGEGCVFCATRDGHAAADAGAAAVTPDLAWQDEAETWLTTLAAGDVFTADDLVSVVGKPVGSVNQVGARLRTWARSRRIAPIGFVPATRAESHGRFLRLWEVR